LTEEYDQGEQVDRKLTSRETFITLLICIAITAFGVWLIDSDEPSLQGFMGVILFLVTFVSGIMVIYCLVNITDNYLKEILIYRRLKKFFPAIIPGLIVNGFGLSRLYESFERPDANNDGLFTITDVGIHIKEIFLASGNRFTVWVANTDVGQFFEMDKVAPSPTFAFIISFFLWAMLWQGYREFTNDVD
jgi:hypothetical protein